MNVSNHFWSLLAGAAIVSLTGMNAPASGQMVQVGEHHPVEIQTPRNYPGASTGEPEVRWSHQLTHVGATYIAIHVVDFDLGPGDYLIVSDADGNQSYTLDGKGKMGAGRFWSQHIKGDTALLDLVVVGRHGGRGFEIDEYVAGFVDMGPTPGSRAICAPDDKQNAVCYAISHPMEYDRGRAVARLLINGSGGCTGWLASASDHLITNEHCISTPSSALNTDYEFMAEAPNCADPNCSGCYPGAVFSGATFIQDSYNLDYVLVQINSGNPAATYGYLPIDNRLAVIGEQIYIPQHPGRRAKEFAIFSTHSLDPNGVPIVQTLTAPGCSGRPGPDVGYYADTEGGSSGSPVLATATHKVIALHHCANCPNRGVPIFPIYAEISQHLGPNPPIAQDVAVSTAVDTQGTFTLPATDDSLPNPPAALTTVVVTLPTNGDLSDPGAGPIATVPYTLAGGGNQVDYTPAPGYQSVDSFDFKANDGGVPPEGGDSNIASVSITVGGPNWDPVANNMNWSTALSTPGDVTLSASDPNGDPLTYTIESLPAAGSLTDPVAGLITTTPYTLVGGGNLVTFDPPPGPNPDVTFDFSVRDATAGSNVATVTVTMGGPLWDPVANPMQWGTGISLPTDIPLSASDPNNDPLTYVVESLPDAGVLTDPAAAVIDTVPYTLAGGANVVTYQPPYGQALQTTFGFSVQDATASSNVATVTIDVGSPHAVINVLLDSDPGWTTEGQWAFGQPTGAGSHAGDPTSGFSGNFAYGFNLNGDYDNDMPAYYLTTPTWDFTYIANAELRFQRWLGVEAGAWDGATVELSSDGATWSTIWENTGGTIDESAWSFHSYDISAIADGQPTVTIRWGMGPTDRSNTYAGWNIDDVVIWGLDTTPVPPPCGVLTYIPGDANMDLAVDGLDVSTFVDMLLNPGGGWTAEQICAADFSDNGAVDVGDISLFVQALLN